jgi:hypothetical protein
MKKRSDFCALFLVHHIDLMEIDGRPLMSFATGYYLALGLAAFKTTQGSTAFTASPMDGKRLFQTGCHLQ